MKSGVLELRDFHINSFRKDGKLSIRSKTNRRPIQQSPSLENVEAGGTDSAPSSSARPKPVEDIQN